MTNCLREMNFFRPFALFLSRRRFSLTAFDDILKSLELSAPKKTIVLNMFKGLQENAEKLLQAKEKEKEQLLQERDKGHEKILQEKERTIAQIKIDHQLLIGSLTARFFVGSF